MNLSAACGSIRLHLRDLGGTGAPLLLLHGMGANTHWWDPVVPHLKGFRAVALDLRGHGDSGWAKTAAGYGIDNMTRDVAAAAKALGWDRFLLAGHSMGGRVALAYAAKRPETLPAVVALDFLCQRVPRRDSRFARGRAMPQPYYAEKEQVLSRFRLQPEGTLLAPAAVRALGETCVRRDEQGRWSWKFDWKGFAIRYPAVWPLLPKVRPPILIVRGGLSTVMPKADLDRLLEGLPDAESVTIHDAYHHVTLDRPAETGEALRSFLLDRWRARDSSVRIGQ